MNDGQNEGVEVSVGGGTAAKRYVDSDPTFGAPGGQGWGLENGTAFGPALMVLVKRGPKKGTENGPSGRGSDPGKGAATPEARGGETAALTRGTAYLWGRAET